MYKVHKGSTEYVRGLAYVERSEYTCYRKTLQKNATERYKKNRWNVILGNTCRVSRLHVDFVGQPVTYVTPTARQSLYRAGDAGALYSVYTCCAVCIEL